MRALVAGGGIGGLAAALSLHEAGVEVEVVESARSIQPYGAGINLLPHAVRELTELGLGEEVEAAGIASKQLVYHDHFGNRIHGEPRGRAAGYRWPQVSIHRGELQMLLLRTVNERLGAGTITCGTAFERFEQHDAGIVAEVRDRASGALRTIEADVLIGADGIDSAARAQLHPDEGPARWSGISMWRGVGEAEPFGSGRTMIMAGSNRREKFVAYPIRGRDGRRLVNWVAEVRLAPEDAPGAHDWQRTDDPSAVHSHFAGWDFDWLDVPGLIASTASVFEYPMIDRDPLPYWGAGRVTLLGDAAHPMYPIGSNGASQAIVDARVVARELAQAGEPAAALAAYEDARRPPTSEIVLANRRHGPEQVMTIVAQRAPQGFAHIEDVISPGELQAIVGRYRRAAGFDVSELNARPSLTVSATPG